MISKRRLCLSTYNFGNDKFAFEETQFWENSLIIGISFCVCFVSLGINHLEWYSSTWEKKYLLVTPIIYHQWWLQEFLFIFILSCLLRILNYIKSNKNITSYIHKKKKKTQIHKSLSNFFYEFYYFEIIAW